jgi:hypothetical protein
MAVGVKMLRQQQPAIQDEDLFSAGGTAPTLLTAEFDGRRACFYQYIVREGY